MPRRVDERTDDGPAATASDSIAAPKPDVAPVVRTETGQVLLVDVGRRAVHTVNRTGGMIWAHCDGKLSVDEITSVLAELYSTEPDAIADDVLRSISELRDLGLVRTADDPPFPESQSGALRSGPDGSSYLVPDPCNCGLDLDEMSWPRPITVARGRIRMGVRFNSDETGEIVRAAIGDWIIDDAAAPVMFTVVLPAGTRPDDRLRDGLYEGRRFQAGPTDRDSIVGLLEHRIETSRPLAPPEVRLAAVGVDGPRGSVLVPARFGLDAQIAELADRSGWRNLAAPVIVDAERLEVVVGAGDRSGERERRPLAGVLWPDAATSRLDADDALRRLVGMIDLHAADDIESFVAALDKLAHRVNAVATPSHQISDVAAALIRSR